MNELVISASMEITVILEAVASDIGDAFYSAKPVDFSTTTAENSVAPVFCACPRTAARSRRGGHACRAAKGGSLRPFDHMSRIDTLPHDPWVALASRRGDETRNRDNALDSQRAF
jgi:hypothetical protein